MFAAQLLSMIGFAFVLPFLPFYIRELGVTDERLVPVWAGVMAAAFGERMGLGRWSGFLLGAAGTALVAGSRQVVAGVGVVLRRRLRRAESGGESSKRDE